MSISDVKYNRLNMVSDMQQKANEENAKLGGVKTEEGIGVSKYNAQKHAILRETVTQYEEEIREYVFNTLVKELNPQGAVEEMLAEIVGTCYIRLYRIAKAEKEYFKAIYDPPHVINSRWDFPELPDPDAKLIGYSPRINADHILKVTNVYSRYETTIQGKMYKALHELERLQRMRKGDKVTAPVAVDVDVEKMGSFGESA